MGRIGTKILLSVILCLTRVVAGIDLPDFFPFGPQAGDESLPPSNDASTIVNLQQPIAFYGENRNYITIYTDGRLDLQATPQSSFASVYVFSADVDTRSLGQVFYRETNDTILLQAASTLLSSTFSGPAMKPVSVFIATWFSVGYFDNHNDRANTFQCVLATDEFTTIAVLLYADGMIEWTTGDADGGANGLGGDPADVGFVGDNGPNSFFIPGSNTTAIINITSSSNTATPGLWLFQVDGANISVPEVVIGLQLPVYNVTEGVDVSVSICAEITAGILERTARVHLVSFDGSATSTSPTDFISVSMDLTFTSGSSVGDCLCSSIQLIDDDILETEEDFAVVLTPVDVDVVNITVDASTATVVISEDPDDGVIVGLDEQGYTVNEMDTFGVLVCVELNSGTLERNVLVNISTFEGSASSLDFIPVSTQLNFTSGDSIGSSLCQLIHPVNDDALELDETFAVMLDAGDVEVSISNASATVTIVEDSNDEATVSMRDPTLTVAEDVSSGIVDVCLQIAGIADGIEVDVIAMLSVTGSERAVEGIDFTAPTPPEVTFSSGSMNNAQQCTTFVIQDDDVLEGSHSFSVTVSSINTSAAGRVVIDTASSVTLIIIQDETPTCPADTTDDRLYGSYQWPDTIHSTETTDSVAELPCKYGNGLATRVCMENGMWAEPDFTTVPECLTRTSFMILQLSNEIVTSENVGNLTGRLSNLVDETTIEDQNSDILEVVTNLLTATANLTFNGITISEETIENIVSLVDGVQEWPEEVVQQQSSMIVQAFEAIATNLAEQDNFAVIEEETVLVAERASQQELEMSGRTFTVGNDSTVEEQRVQVGAADEAGLRNEEIASISLPPSIFRNTEFENGTETSVVFTFYEDAILFPLDNRSNIPVTEVGTSVIGAIVGGRALFNLTEPISIRIQLNIFSEENSTVSNVRCASYDFNASGDNIPDWSTSGCETLDVTADGIVICSCNHLTNFASLVDIQARTDPQPMLSPAADLALSTASIIGVVLSIVGCTLTIITYLAFRNIRKRHASKLHVQLCLAILCMMVVFVAGIDRTEIFAGCVIVSALIHYFTLASVLWMAAEAWLMFQKLVIVFVQVSTKYIIIVSVICWMVPFPFVVIPLAINRNFMVSETFCFISNQEVFFGAFLGPIFVVILFNTGIFCVVVFILIKHAKRVRRRSKTPQYKKTLQNLINVFSISSMFGLAWLFGAFTIMEANAAFQFLFVLFNTFQGVFLFLFFCVLNKEARSAWLHVLQCGCKNSLKKGLLKSTPSSELGYKNRNTSRTHTIMSYTKSSTLQSGTLPSDFRQPTVPFSNVEVPEYSAAIPSDLSTDVIENLQELRLSDSLTDVQEIQMELFQGMAEESSLSEDSSDSELCASQRRRVQFETAAQEDSQTVANPYAE